MELFIRADNVLNRVNYGGFSGNLRVAVLRPADERTAAAAPDGRICRSVC